MINNYYQLIRVINVNVVSELTSFPFIFIHSILATWRATLSILFVWCNCNWCNYDELR